MPLVCMLGTALVVTLTIGVFQNCAHQTATDLSSIAPFENPFAASRVILNSKSFKDGDPSLKTIEGLKVTYVFETMCVKEQCASGQSAQAISCSLLNSNLNEGQAIQALPKTLVESVTHQELLASISLHAVDQRCILGVTEEKVYKSNTIDAAWFNDPKYSEQTYLDLIGWSAEISRIGSYGFAKVGIIDTGIPISFKSSAIGETHEDVQSSGFFRGKGNCNDMDPFAESIFCLNLDVRLVQTPGQYVCNGHGLAVTGVINAVDNNLKGLV